MLVKLTENMRRLVSSTLFTLLSHLHLCKRIIEIPLEAQGVSDCVQQIARGSYNWIAILIQFCLGVSVAHKGKPILCLVCNFIIFISNVLQHFEVMKPAPVRMKPELVVDDSLAKPRSKGKEVDLEKVATNVPWIYCCHWARLFSHFEPRITSCRPNKPFHQLVCVVMKLLHTCSFRFICFDIFRLHFVDHLKPV